MILRLLLVILVLSMSTFLVAQSFQPASLNPDFQMTGLFNPNNLSINHSMSFMSGISSNNTGFYQSRYTNHLMYRFSKKLDLAVDLNFVNFGSFHHQGWSSIQSNQDNNSAVLPNFSLEYRPSDNTTFKIEFHSYGVPVRNQTDWWRR